jgi:oxygen-independent coproporphyrinogen III oxidase
MRKVATKRTSMVSPHALYLHIPFCGTRCTYCAFNTYTHQEAQIPAYVAALCQELAHMGAAAQAAHGQLLPVCTIFFGGGTPSLLSPAQVSAILTAAGLAFAVATDAEITLEANPGTVDFAYLDALRASGINRLSLGMQSVHSAELALMARDHAAYDVPRVVAEARRAGFTNLSLDLIFNMPQQTEQMWSESVMAALALQPDHLSMYALELEKGTILTGQVGRGLLPTPDDDLAAEMYDTARGLAAQAGFIHYEISNWAQPGKTCQHNLQYWRNLPYIGLGAGAHGYADGYRYEVVKPIAKYIGLANSPNDSVFPLPPSTDSHHQPDRQAMMVEHFFTGLRLLQSGVSCSEFAHRFGQPPSQAFGAALAKLMRQGLLVQSGDFLQLTPAAYLISNQVFMALI